MSGSGSGKSTSNQAINIPSIYKDMARTSYLNVVEDEDGDLEAVLGEANGRVYIATLENGDKYPDVRRTSINFGKIGIKGMEPHVSYFGNDPNNDNAPVFMLTYIDKNSGDDNTGDIKAVVLEVKDSLKILSGPFEVCQGGFQYQANPEHYYNLMLRKEVYSI